MKTPIVLPTLSLALLAGLVAGAEPTQPSPSAPASGRPATVIPSGEPAKVTHDWPCYTGPDGAFADPSKVPLLDDFTQARLVWVSEHEDLGWAKSGLQGGSARYPKSLHPSGGASLIVAQGLVLAAYFHPQNSVVADDVLLALDAATGQVKWKQVFAGKGVNCGGGKGPAYGPTPAAGDGAVFSLGTAGRVYAVELASGKVRWESDLGEIHRQIVDLTGKTPATDDRYDGLGKPLLLVFKNPLIVIDGVVMILARDAIENGKAGTSLFGLDGATGKVLWKIPSVEAVPCPVKLDKQTYALTQTHLAMQLIRPRTGETLWQEKLGYRRYLTPVVADGLAFVPRLKDPTKGPSKEAQPLLTAFALSGAGATLLWQSERLPIQDRLTWLAYRDGVVYGNANRPGDKSRKVNPRQVMAFDAKTGTELWSYGDETLFKGEFHVWGDRIVLVGDNGHEQLGAKCHYWPLTLGVNDLKKSGGMYAPRVIPGYQGVCAEAFEMRDAFADGYQFTRAINMKTEKGAIMCWDLRKTNR
jgi:outer membrane protein assembly factor BamB